MEAFAHKADKSKVDIGSVLTAPNGPQNEDEFYFDYQNGEYGFNTDPERGADTFHPFKRGDFDEVAFACNTESWWGNVGLLNKTVGFVNNYNGATATGDKIIANRFSAVAKVEGDYIYFQGDKTSGVPTQVHKLANETICSYSGNGGYFVAHLP